MRGQIVQFVETNRIVESFVVKDHFEFKPKGRWQFLQRLAWRFLHWSRSLEQAVEDRFAYTRHVIDTGDVMQRLVKQRAAMFDYGYAPKELLIGSADFAELMGTPEIRQAMTFYVNHDRSEIMGLKVTIVPWMRGMLVMPASIK